MCRTDDPCRACGGLGLKNFLTCFCDIALVKASDETAKTTLESLLHSSIRPDYYRDHAAISPGQVQHCLTQFHAAFFIRDAFGIPLS
jgi:hypothetical protein